MFIKPCVSVRTHLFLAAFLWTAVGGILMGRGVLAARYVTHGFALGVFGVVLGTVKALGVLDRAAIKNICRIRQLRDKTCIGGVYSWRTWLFVLIMMAGGRLLRSSGVPKELLTVLFFAVGWGLLLSSRLAWKEWRTLGIGKNSQILSI